MYVFVHISATVRWATATSDNDSNGDDCIVHQLTTLNNLGALFWYRDGPGCDFIDPATISLSLVTPSNSGAADGTSFPTDPSKIKGLFLVSSIIIKKLQQKIIKI